MANNYKVVMGDSASQISDKFYANLKKNIRIEKNTDGNAFELDWIDEIEKMIIADTGSTDTPAIIRESWQFTTGGNDIAIVNACNIYHNGFYTPVEYSEDLYPSSSELPYGENHYIYALTVIFVRCFIMKNWLINI